MKVIKRLRHKMVVTVLIIQAVVFALVLLALNMAVGGAVLQETSRFLRHFMSYGVPLLEQGRSLTGQPPSVPHAEGNGEGHVQKRRKSDWPHFWKAASPFTGHRHFRSIFGISYNGAGEFESILASFPPRYTEEELGDLMVLGSDLPFTERPRFFAAPSGTFLYIKEQSPQGIVVALADITRDLYASRDLLLISGGVYLLSILISLAVACFFAERWVRPVQTAFETQKQFIADAGHELKTPVSVIAANADALAGEIGESKWLGYIKSETQRMARLINDLLYLAKNDAGRIPSVHSSMDLSRVVEAAVLPFESIVFEQQKRLELFVQEGIQWVGDSGGIAQAVVILLDNAIKNSPVDSLIRVSLSMEANRRGQGRFGKGHSHPVIAVYNQGEGLSQEEMAKVFGRFYRGDTSRARETGGSGLGLSIAQAIALSHQGSISVEGKRGEWISFSLHLGRVVQGSDGERG